MCLLVFTCVCLCLLVYACSYMMCLHAILLVCTYSRLSHLLLLLLGSELLKPDVLSQIPSQQRKRQEAIFELIHSEKAYVHSLNLVKEVGVVYITVN